MSEREKLPIIPEIGKKYLCKIQHYKHRDIQEIELVGAPDDDCTWRTADDNSELNEMNWDVIEAKEIK